MEPQPPQGSQDPHEVRAAAWPDDGFGPAEQDAATRPPYGPRFVWRARVMWLLVAVFQIAGALLLAWAARRGGLVGAAPWVLAGLLAILAVVFLRTRQAVARGERWAAAPSQALAVGLVVGGLVRFVVALGQSSLLIPLEPLLGFWVMNPADAPPSRLALPSDRRTGVVAALVIALELTNVLPAVPGGVPGLTWLNSGPDTLELAVEPICQPPGTGWERVPIDVHWDWRGLDVFGSARDTVTIAVASSTPDMQVDTTDYAYGLFGDTMLPDFRTVVVTLPLGTRTGGYGVQAVQVLDPVPASLTVTVTYRHGDRWVVEQTAACPA